MGDLKEYRFASSPAEAVALLRRGPGRGAYIAGGTDLLRARPDCDFVVDVNHAGIGAIDLRPEGDLFLGAAATVLGAGRDERVRGFAGGALAEALSACALRSGRPTATVGGRLCHGGCGGNLAPVLLVLDASCVIADEATTTNLPLSRFYRPDGGTVLADRLLAGVALPGTARLRRCLCQRHARCIGGEPLAQVAVGLDVVENRVVTVRIGIGAATTAPGRALLAEAVLTGLDPRAVGPDQVHECGGTAAAEIVPIDDHQASAEYRRDLVAGLVGRLVSRALAWQETPEPERYA
ncbi:MAG: xanthine dehydrogenase family protein subunit M [Candidatus Krumholzibacteriia bacterium]